jgi:tetratricopeptide (TPR) repeat protein
MSQLRVFLSHSSQDKAVADQFAFAFRQAGANVWYDEESLGTGHLRRTIMKELSDRPIFVVLLSPVALSSSWVLDECEWAYDLQREEPSRVMLPVVVQPLERTDLNAALYLRSFKRVEAGDLRPLPTIADAATQALRLLGMTPEGQVSTPSAPQASESAADLVLRGKGLSVQKKYAEAVPLFVRATQLESGNWEAWFNLGYVHGEMEHWQESLVACEHALTLRPNDGTIWLNKTQALNNLGRYREGLAAAEQATTLQPDLAEAWSKKAQALLSLGRHREGLAAAEQATTLQPDNSMAWVNKSWALINLNRHQEGLAAAEQATALQPDNSMAWNNKGAALYSLKRYPEALAAYDQALTLNPNLTLFWKNKALALRRLGHSEEAEAAERQAKMLGG